MIETLPHDVITLGTLHGETTPSPTPGKFPPTPRWCDDITWQESFKNDIVLYLMVAYNQLRHPFLRPFNI